MRIILFLSIFFTSCFKQEKKDPHLHQVNLQQACKKACYYEYETFKSLKEIKEDSLSLSLEQITGFHENCLFYCTQSYPVTIPVAPQEENPVPSPEPKEKKVRPKVQKTPKPKVKQNKDFKTFEEMEGL